MGRALDGFIQTRGMLRHRSRLPVLKTSFHGAPLLRNAGPSRVFIRQMDFNPRDSLTESAQRVLHHPGDVCGQPLIPIDVVIRIDLNLHFSSIQHACIPLEPAHVHYSL